MKRKNLIFAVFAATVVAAASCNKERATSPDLDGGVPAGSPMTITAGLDTKIYYKSGNTICWTTGDNLKVFNDADKPSGSIFTTQDGGELNADFTCDSWVGGTPVFAVHSAPAGEVGQCVYDGSKATAYLNPSQAIVNKNSFSKYAVLSVGTISPSDDAYVIPEMKNVFGSIGFKIESSGVKSFTLKGNNEEYLAGWVDVDYNDGQPTWTPRDSGDKVTSKSIVVSISGSGGAEDKTFTPGSTYYINVLPQTFENGLALEIEDKTGGVATRVIDKEIVIERSKKHSITKAIDAGLIFELTIDCTTVGATTFKYDKDGKTSDLSTRVSGATYDVIDFWAASHPDHLFNGAVRYWSNNGGGLNFKAHTYVRFPLIPGYKLSKITDFAVVPTSVRKHIITSESTAEKYSDAQPVEGGEEKGVKYGDDPVSFILTDSYDAGKNYYIVCNSETGIRFKLTYQKVNIAQE